MHVEILLYCKYNFLSFITYRFNLCYHNISNSEHHASECHQEMHGNFTTVIAGLVKLDSVWGLEMLKLFPWKQNIQI